MRLVVDTNVLLSALIADSATRRIIFRAGHELYYPKDALEELGHCKGLIRRKSSVSEKGLDELISETLKKLEIVDARHFYIKMGEAECIMAPYDKEDAVFIALALSIPECAIWSNDKHLRMQEYIPVVTTEELLKRFGFYSNK